MPDPTSERPSVMKRRALELLHEASTIASTLGTAQLMEKKRLIQKAKQFLEER